MTAFAVFCVSLFVVTKDKLISGVGMCIRDRQLAEDITQETFLRFFGQDINLDNDKKLPYLYKICLLYTSSAQDRDY